MCGLRVGDGVASVCCGVPSLFWAPALVQCLRSLPLALPLPFEVMPLVHAYRIERFEKGKRSTNGGDQTGEVGSC